MFPPAVSGAVNVPLLLGVEYTVSDETLDVPVAFVALGFTAANCCVTDAGIVMPPLPAVVLQINSAPVVEEVNPEVVVVVLMLSERPLI